MEEVDPISQLQAVTPEKCTCSIAKIGRSMIAESYSPTSSIPESVVRDYSAVFRDCPGASAEQVCGGDGVMRHCENPLGRAAMLQSFKQISSEVV